MLNMHGENTDLRIQEHHSYHGNNVPNLISANENHLKSCEVAVESNSISVQWTDTSLISTVKNQCTLFQVANVSLLCFNH